MEVENQLTKAAQNRTTQQTCDVIYKEEKGSGYRGRLPMRKHILHDLAAANLQVVLSGSGHLLKQRRLRPSFLQRLTGQMKVQIQSSDVFERRGAGGHCIPRSFGRLCEMRKTLRGPRPFLPANQ
jgi:hypothetical protein